MALILYLRLNEVKIFWKVIINLCTIYLVGLMLMVTLISLKNKSKTIYIEYKLITKGYFLKYNVIAHVHK